MAATSKLVLVTGDAICEHNYFLGKRKTADSDASPGFRFDHRGGGSLLLWSLIDRALRGHGDWKAEFGLDPAFDDMPPAYHAYCLWAEQLVDPNEKDPNKQKRVWRALDPPLGYGHPVPVDAEPGAAPVPFSALRGRRTDLAAPPEIVVIDDAGLGYRTKQCRAHWPFRDDWRGDHAPRWVVLKQSGAIGEGELWQALTTECRDNLVLIVSADQLREYSVRIGRGLSWEATTEDLTAELRDNHHLAPLRKARHLIVTFRADGAYWLDRTKHGDVSRLVFDAEHAEGEWADSQGDGSVFGYMSCYTAGVVRQLCTSGDQPNIEMGLVAGIAAGRELMSTGYVPAPADEPDVDGKLRPSSCPRFPIARIAHVIAEPEDRFVTALVPQDARAGGSWMMLDEWQVHARDGSKAPPHDDVAEAVAMLGPEALDRLLPVARFGALQTVDRGEIESLRTIRQLIEGYQAKDQQKKPLSLGVFGPPGAGKSFGVIQIAKAVLRAEDDDILTFNLSQFSSPDELNGAFHRVRDRVLSGHTPLVFWDEFDSQGYRWLQYLLAPMQDGVFQDGEITHPVGKCIFVFAGATSPTYGSFGPCDPEHLEPKERDALLADPDERREVEGRWLEFVLKKGPDFRSRLVGYLNVLGPNQRQKLADAGWRPHWVNDSDDRCFPIRRALFIRSQLGLKRGAPCRLDTGVLRALLQVPLYKAGARSLEFLCKHLRENGGDSPTRSHLPGFSLLDMHVNAKLFWQIIERDREFAAVAPQLAEGMHEDWRKTLKTEEDLANKRNKPWADLDADLRVAALAQAGRIPHVVSLAGLQVVPGPWRDDEEKAEARRRLQAHADILAEAEHNQWMVERMIAGWRYARLSKKDEARQLHPLLIPYAQLAEYERAKDQNMVSGNTSLDIPDYCERVQRVGFHISEKPPEPPSA